MFILLLIVSSFILYVDRKIYGTYLTPTIFLIFPFIGILLSNLIFGHLISLEPLTTKSLLIWFVGIIVFWIPSLFVFKYFIGHKKIYVFEGFKELPHLGSNLLRFFAIILLIIMYKNLFYALRTYNYDINSPEYGSILSSGIAAHSAIWLRIIIIYFLLKSKFSKDDIGNWIIILLWLIYSILYNSKIWIIIPFMTFSLGKFVILQKKIKTKTLVYVILSGILLFYVSYSVSFGHSAPFRFIFSHFLFYLNSGIVGLSEYMNNNREIGLSFEFLYQPIFNIYYKLSGVEPKSILSDLLTVINGDQASNVKTIFGTIYIYGGVIGGIITVFIGGTLSYSLLILNYFIKNYFLFILYLLILSGLFLGWFDYLFNTINYYEMAFVSLLFALIQILLFYSGKIKIHT